MSEYQYYEFQAVDQPLNTQQIGELRALSTRATITATRFQNEYQWGDFRGDPVVLMRRYFDAFVYVANWGTRELMLRLPRRLLEIATVSRYCSGDSLQAWTTPDHVVVAVRSTDEPDEDFDGGEGWMPRCSRFERSWPAAICGRSTSAGSPCPGRGSGVRCPGAACTSWAEDTVGCPAGTQVFFAPGC